MVFSPDKAALRLQGGFAIFYGKAINWERKNSLFRLSQNKGFVVSYRHGKRGGSADGSGDSGGGQTRKEYALRREAYRRARRYPRAGGARRTLVSFLAAKLDFALLQAPVLNFARAFGFCQPRFFAARWVFVCRSFAVPLGVLPVSAVCPRSLDGAALPKAGQFYKKRIARIVPSYYFAVFVILFAVALPSGEYGSAEECLRDLLPTLTLRRRCFRIFCWAPSSTACSGQRLSRCSFTCSSAAGCGVC